MKRSSIPGAPARRLARAGALVLMALATACGGADAGAGDGPRVIELAGDTIRLEPGVRLVEVEVRSGTAEFEPTAVEAKQGDMVRFTAHDHGGHALAFEGGALSAEAAQYLEQSGQMRAPPLIERGAAWVITLDGAPAGVYPFRCATHNAAGQLTVTPR